jgi:uncharacterized membrane protein
MLGRLRWASFVFAFVGLALSIYLTIIHYVSPSSLACPDSGIVNCTQVTTSPQSILFGIPVPVYGLIFFVFLAIFNFPPLVKRYINNSFRYIRLLIPVSATVFVLYLIYLELVVIGKICLYCTGVHLSVIVLLILGLLEFFTS